MCFQLLKTNLPNQILLIMAMVAGMRSYSQDYVDIVSANYLISPANTFDFSDQKTTLQEGNFTFTLPIPLNENLNLITGLFTEATSTKLEPQGDYIQFYTINPRIGLNFKINDRWSSNIVFLPKISSDLSTNLTSGDFQYGGVATFKIKKNEHFSYRFGAYYNSELFGPLFVPIVGLYYLSPDEKYEVNLSLPLLGDANMRLKENLWAGVNFIGIVRTYNHQDDLYIMKASNEPYLYLQYRMGKSILFRGSVGYTIGRYYRVYADRDKIDFGISALKFGDFRTRLNPDFADGLMLKASLIYRFYL